MASNFFGNLFRITTFGESHGKAIGVVIDGCPSNLPLSTQEIQEALEKRRSGKTRFTSPRKEEDSAEILSGVFEGKTTGAPIAILISNRDAESTAYDEIKHLYRPGHANFTYLGKYGHFDHRGGGRASARETAARVAAGAVAKKLLSFHHIECLAYIDAIGGIQISPFPNDDHLKESPIFCPDPIAEEAMIRALDQVKEEGDSLGGIVACTVKAPLGLGDPVYNKLEAALASAMLSIPASKGFEIGEGFRAAQMKGSEHNDAFELDEHNHPKPSSNHAGGLLGGISTGAPLFFRVAFKPTSSITKTQNTVSLSGEKTTLTLPKLMRHDPCVAIRAVPIVEAMANLVLADALLMHKTTSKIGIRPH